MFSKRLLFRSIHTPFRGLCKDWLARCQILWLGEIANLIYILYLSVAACMIVWADPPLRYTGMLLGRSTGKQTTTTTHLVSKLLSLIDYVHLGFVCLFAGWLLALRPSIMLMYPRNGFAQTSLYAAIWDRGCRSNFLYQPVTVYWHRPTSFSADHVTPDVCRGSHWRARF